MKSLLGKSLLLLSLLLFIQPSAYSQGGKLAKVTAALKKNLVGATLALTLVGALPFVAQAQEGEVQQNFAAEEEVVASPWTIVDETTPQYDYLHNVFNLHVASIAEPETQFLFPVAYLGKSVLGEDIFIAYERPAGTSILEEVAADVELSLINYQGKVWEDVSIIGRTVVEDRLDGFLDLVILSIAGAEVDSASPLQLGIYPLTDGGAQVRLAGYQRQSYRPTMLEEEIELGAASFRLGTRDDCRVVFNPNWASVKVGLHTCRGGGKDGFTGGLMVLYRHKLAAIQNAAVNDFAIVRAISPDVVDTAAAVLAGQALPVEARGKLATTWGALKKN